MLALSVGCFFFFFFWFVLVFGCHVWLADLVPQPGIELGFTAVKAQSPNHWTAREVFITGF